jgi:hypothetical protein
MSSLEMLVLTYLTRYTLPDTLAEESPFWRPPPRTGAMSSLEMLVLTYLTRYALPDTLAEESSVLEAAPEDGGYKQS